MNTHVVDKHPTHFCPDCGKGFLKAQTLKNHIPIHSGDTFYPTVRSPTADCVGVG